MPPKKKKQGKLATYGKSISKRISDALEEKPNTQKRVGKKVRMIETKHTKGSSYVRVHPKATPKKKSKK